MASFTQLPSGNWRPPEEPLRGRDFSPSERNNDRSGSPKPRAALNARTFGDLVVLHREDIYEVGRPPRRSRAAVLEALKKSLGTPKLPQLNRTRLIEFGRKLMLQLATLRGQGS